jgi:hypothetical protein
MWLREAYHNFLNELKIDIESPNRDLIEKTKKNYPEINSSRAKITKANPPLVKKGCPQSDASVDREFW